MKRRQFIALAAAAAAWPLAARAQQPGKTYRLGLLANGPAVGPLDARRAALLSALSARGFAEGKNLVLLHRAADARPERLRGLLGRAQAEHGHGHLPFGLSPALA